jgi:hypothetical protein
MINKVKFDASRSFKLEISEDEAADWHAARIIEEPWWDWAVQLAAKVGLPACWPRQGVGEAP